MLLICLYRDNEVSPEHIVSTQLLPRLPSGHLEIQLEPLTLSNVIKFVSECLRTPERPEGSARGSRKEKEDPNLKMLSEVILNRTQGSPLFVAQVRYSRSSPRLLYSRG